MTIEKVDGVTIVYSKLVDLLLPSGYKCINLCGIIFTREDATISDETIRHERTHTLQEKELLYVFFYILYVLFFIWNFIRYWNWKKSYRNICFELEAEENEDDVDYNDNREHYAWTNYLN